jgi:hypothetical protein
MEKPEKSTRETQDSSVPMVNGSGKPAKPMVTVSDVSDEDESPTKKRRTAAPTPPVRLSVQEVVMDAHTAQDRSTVVMRPTEIIEPNGDASWSPTPSAAPSSFPHAPSPTLSMKSAFGVKTSAPREPSKLRFSYQADKETASAEEKPVSPLPAPLPGSRAHPKETRTTSPKSKLPPKDAAMAMEVDELPKYSFTLAEVIYPAGPSHVKARSAVAAMPLLSLPTFEFKLVAPSTNGFNRAPASMKAPTASASGVWVCGLCGLKNPDSAKEKCTICEEPRSSAAADAPPQKTFDWSKNAIKVPTTITPAEVPPQATFDWSKTNIKPPTTSAGSWECNTCMLPNPDSAKLKCTVCDAPRPAS